MGGQRNTPVSEKNGCLVPICLVTERYSILEFPNFLCVIFLELLEACPILVHKMSSHYIGATIFVVIEFSGTWTQFVVNHTAVQ